MKFMRGLFIVIVIAAILGVAPSAVKADLFPGYITGIQI